MARRVRRVARRARRARKARDRGGTGPEISVSVQVRARIIISIQQRGWVHGRETHVVLDTPFLLGLALEVGLAVGHDVRWLGSGTW